MSKTKKDDSEGLLRYRLFVRCHSCNKEARFFSRSAAVEMGWVRSSKKCAWRCPNCAFRRTSINISCIDHAFVHNVLINLFGRYDNFSEFVRKAIDAQLEKERKIVLQLLEINKALKNSEYEIESLPNIKNFKIIERFIFKNDDDE